MDLTGVMFVVLKARGVVTGSVACEDQVIVYCLVLVSVVQVVWTQSLQAMHRAEHMYFFLLVIRWDQMRHVKIFDGPGFISTSPASVMRRSMTARASYYPSEKMCTVQHQPYISRAPKQSPGCAASCLRARS